MILLSAFKQATFTHQKALIESVSLVQFLQVRRLSNSLALINDSPAAKEEKVTENISQKKIIRVAIVGRTNAGKSTLVNAILNLDLCGVSKKSHTTTKQLKAAFTKGDTQVVFLDTPGFVSKKEFNRFNLPSNFSFSKAKEFMDKVDIIGVVHELSTLRDVFRLPLSLVQCLHEIPESKPMFLIINKIDKITDKKGLEVIMNKVQRHLKEGVEESDRKNDKTKIPKIFGRFSEIFFISALDSTSVSQVANYLLEQAKPGDWLFDENEICDTPLHVIVVDILRAEVLNILPQEVPYECKYNVEYMKETDLECLSLKRKTLVEQLEIKERKILRKILGPVKENNEYRRRHSTELYQYVTKISDVNRKRRIAFYGHLARMDPERLGSWKNKAGLVHGNRERPERDRDNSRRPAPKRYPEKESGRSEFLGKAEVKNRREMERKREHSERMKEYWKRRKEKEKNKKKKG